MRKNLIKPNRSEFNMVKDEAITTDQLLIPTYSTPTLNGWVDTYGQSFGLDTSTKRLTVRGNIEWLSFPTITEVNTLIANIPPSSGTLQTVTNGTGNNVTSNALTVNGVTGYSPIVNGLSMFYTPSDSSGITGIFNGGGKSGIVNFTPLNSQLTYWDGTSLKAIILQTEDNTNSGVVINSRLGGVENAINPHDAPNLEQVQNLIGSISVGSLQQVTNIGNTTSNSMKITGLTNYSATVNGLGFIYSAGSSGINNTVANAINGSLSFATASSSLSYIYSTGSSTLTLQKEDVTNPSTIINGRLRINGAVYNDEAVTLAQLNSIASSTLQSVTNGVGNNTTSNALQVTGSTGLDASVSSAFVGYNPTGDVASIGALRTGGGVNNSFLNFNKQTNILAGITSSGRLGIYPAEQPGEAITLSQAQGLISAAGTLQSVTTGTGNNITSNAMQITGSANLDLTKDGLLFAYGNTISSIAQAQSGVIGSIINFRVENPTSSGIAFETRISGKAAINPTDYTRLDQNDAKYGALSANNNWSGSNTFSSGSNSVTISPTYLRATGITGFVDHTSQGISFTTTADGFSGSINRLPLTALRIWSMPDKSGTVAMTSDIPSNFVTTNTAQTFGLTGQKIWSDLHTFRSGMQITPGGSGATAAEITNGSILFVEGTTDDTIGISVDPVNGSTLSFSNQTTGFGTRLLQPTSPTIFANIRIPNKNGTLALVEDHKALRTTFTSNGTSTVYNIPHGLGATPIVVIATRGSSNDYNVFSTSWDGTNITLTYENPPIAGTITINYLAYIN